MSAYLLLLRLYVLSVLGRHALLAFAEELRRRRPGLPPRRRDLCPRLRLLLDHRDNDLFLFAADLVASLLPPPLLLGGGGEDGEDGAGV